MPGCCGLPEPTASCRTFCLSSSPGGGSLSCGKLCDTLGAPLRPSHHGKPARPMSKYGNNISGHLHESLMHPPPAIEDRFCLVLQTRRGCPPPSLGNSACAPAVPSSTLLCRPPSSLPCILPPPLFSLRPLPACVFSSRKGHSIVEPRDPLLTGTSAAFRECPFPDRLPRLPLAAPQLPLGQAAGRADQQRREGRLWKPSEPSPLLTSSPLCCQERELRLGEGGCKE